jgi:hypothetical protein
MYQVDRDGSTAIRKLWETKDQKSGAAAARSLAKGQMSGTRIGRRAIRLKIAELWRQILVGPNPGVIGVAIERIVARSE